MERLQQVALEEALGALGALLDYRGLRYHVALIGGGALLLLGAIDRPTRDVDIVGLVRDDEVVRAAPLPPPLVDAVEAIGRERGLSGRWLNAGPTALLDAGLPDGFLRRAVRRDFAGLATSVASRYDQVHFKLYAAVDQGPDSKHAQDLLRLAPEPGELEAAAAWCRRHDPSSAFADQLRQALEYLSQRLRDADG